MIQHDTGGAARAPHTAGECAVATVRLPLVSDAPALARLMTPAIAARLARQWHGHQTRAEVEDRIIDALAAANAGRSLPLVIVADGEVVDGEMIGGKVAGWIAITLTDEPGVATLTYWLGERFQGRGILAAVLPRALAMARRLVVGLREVHAAVQPDNERSICVLERLGATLLRVGTIAGVRGVEPCGWWRIA